MASHYDQHPEALEAALERSAFVDRLLEGTHLRYFLSSTPEDAAQERAHGDLATVVERSWALFQQAQQQAVRHGLVATGGFLHA